MFDDARKISEALVHLEALEDLQEGRMLLQGTSGGAGPSFFDA